MWCGVDIIDYLLAFLEAYILALRSLHEEIV